MGPYIYCQTHNIWLDANSDSEMAEHFVIGPRIHCKLVDDPTNLDTLSVVWSQIPLEKRLTTVVGL